MFDLNKLREEIAALEHEQWMEWAKTLMKKENLSQERMDRWGLLLKPYNQLTEEQKDQDRIWADKVLGIIEEAYKKDAEISLRMIETTIKNTTSIIETLDKYMAKINSRLA